MNKRICRYPHTIKDAALYARWRTGEPIPGRQVFYMCQDCRWCHHLAAHVKNGAHAKRWCLKTKHSTHYRARACGAFELQTLEAASNLEK